MPGHVKVGGAWKAVNGLHVKVSGAWKEVSAGYVKVSGVWKQFFAAAAPDLADLTDPLISQVIGAGGDRPIVSVRFNVNGDIEEAVGDTGAALSYSKVGEWLTNLSGFTASEWEVNFNVDSEDNGDPGTWTGSTRGSFIGLGSSRTFTWTKDADDLGTANSEVTCTLREIATPANSDSRSNLSYDAEIST